MEESVQKMAAAHALLVMHAASQRLRVLNDPSSVLPYSVQTPLKKSVPSCLTGFKGPLYVFSTPLLCCESMLCPLFQPGHRSLHAADDVKANQQRCEWGLPV